MNKFKVGDNVKCDRIGDGVYRVTQIKGTGSHEEVFLVWNEGKLLTGKWIYAAHCHVDFDMKKENIRRSHAARQAEINKVVNRRPTKKARS